ncbi:hypothetical protein CL658_05635 [bacterium]|nr:hypothetical protein [bacterium]|tara:strand:+ start:3391 stop:4155 length:765 start_codon:yes stop_codon:yes gene_type:complete
MRQLINGKKIFFCVCALIFFYTNTIIADFSFSLVDNTINLGKGKLSTTAQVKNTGGYPVAISLSMLSKYQDRYGNESNERVEEPIFLIYPERLILMPGETELIKIGWIGPIDLTKELAFRAVCEEKSLENVNKKDNRKQSFTSGKISFLTKYALNLFIKVKDSKTELNLESTEFYEKEGDTLVRFTLKNTGNGILKGNALTFFLPNKKTNTDIILNHSLFYIFPGSTRRFEYKINQNKNNLTKNARFTYELQNL